MQAQADRNKTVIVGGGTAGITVAARLRRAANSLNITLIEPSDKHYYQPLWTLVGGGVFPREATELDEASVIPEGVTWIQDAVTEFLPEENTVLTKEGKRIGYDYLIVAPGIQLDWHNVKGLPEGIGHDGVCSNYAYEYVNSTWEDVQQFTGGNAIFTQPSTPIKCGGAPQKIAYLAEDHFRKSGVRDKATVSFISGMGGIFSVKKYADALNTVLSRKGMEAHYRHDLVEIRAESKEAVFQNLVTQEEAIFPYDMIHVTPPMSAPHFIKHGPLANEAGWVDVDKQTLQHTRYVNIFSLGDASSLPTSKSGAAVPQTSSRLDQ